jgi:hypothetical protein
MLTNYGRCTCEIKSRIAIAKAAFNKKMALFTRKIAEQRTCENKHLYMTRDFTQYSRWKGSNIYQTRSGPLRIYRYTEMNEIEQACCGYRNFGVA